jgi:hypothetical protein
MVNKDLSLLVGRQREATEDPTSEVETVARPDVRVNVRVVVTPSAPGEPTSALQITVENHSPRTFFLSSVGMKMDDGHGLWFKRDAFFETPNGPQRIESGDSYSFHVAPPTFADIDTHRIVCAEAHDKVGRVFSSDPEQTRRSLERLMKNDKPRRDAR